MAGITIKERLARKRVQWEKANDALEALLGEGTVESYSFSDSNGTQNAKRRKIAEYKDLIAELEAEIEELERQLQGGGIRTFGTNRYG